MRIATPVSLLFTAAVWWPLLSSAMAQQAENAGQRPSFQPFRYDEDWRSLEDRSTHTDWLDSLKYIPLGRPKWFATVGGEIRERFELLDHPGFGNGPADSNGYFLQRYLLSSDFHFGAGVRFFGELQSGLENGRKGGPRPTDLDRLDVHQAFLDWKVFSSDTNSLTIRVGRQELGFGSGRLVSPAEGLNLRRSLDGARVTVKLGKVVWNITALRLVKSSQGVFDDYPDHAQSIWGTGLSAPHPIWKHANLSLYYLGLDRKNSVFTKGVGRAIRHTIGSRSWKSAGAWDYNYEAIVQWGSFHGRPIRAWALSEDTGYSLSHNRFRPRFGIRADVTSGDGGMQSHALGSFDPLLPAAPVYSGPSGVLGATNLIDITPTLRVSLSQALSLSWECSSFWRESLADGVYTPFITPIRADLPTADRYVATAPSVTVTWKANRHTTLSGIYTRFLAGGYFDSVPPARDVNYYSMSLSYRF
jgi:hypothetical protein